MCLWRALSGPPSDTKPAHVFKCCTYATVGAIPHTREMLPEGLASHEEHQAHCLIEHAVASPKLRARWLDQRGWSPKQSDMLPTGACGGFTKTTCVRMAGAGLGRAVCRRTIGRGQGRTFEVSLAYYVCAAHARHMRSQAPSPCPTLGPTHHARNTCSRPEQEPPPLPLLPSCIPCFTVPDRIFFCHQEAHGRCRARHAVVEGGVRGTWGRQRVPQVMGVG